MSAKAHTAAAAQLAELRDLSLAGLRGRWIEIFDTPAPTAARSEYLIRAISFHIQSEMYGGISPSISKKLRKLGDGPSVDSKGPPTSAGKLRLGTRLLRDWQGETHEVQIVEGGYHYRGANYQSLSEIARLITGTRWSGPLFFGLKGKPVKAENGGAQAAHPTYVVDLGCRSARGGLRIKRSANNHEANYGL